MFDQYWNPHYKDKTASWPSYLYNGDPYTCKDLYIETGPSTKQQQDTTNRTPYVYNSWDIISGLIPGLRPDNGRRRYFVTTSLIGWAQT